MAFLQFDPVVRLPDPFDGVAVHLALKATRITAVSILLDIAAE